MPMILSTPLLSEPSFLCFEVKVVTSEDYIKSDSGLIYRNYEVDKGDCPKAGQQVFSFIVFEQSFPFLFVWTLCSV
ncbi:hypothetical protein CRYUN_Cryun14cG0013400 [Craigia yunnanensis]